MSNVTMDDVVQIPKIEDMLNDVLKPEKNSCLEKVIPAVGVALLAIGTVAVIANALSCDTMDDTL